MEKSNISEPCFLSTSELILLRYLDCHPVGISLPNYFTYQHYIDTQECIEKFVIRRLLIIAPPTQAIKWLAVPELKNILKDYGLPTNGKKDDLIYRIQSYLSSEELQNYCKHEYYILTSKGLNLLRGNLDDKTYYNRYTNSATTKTKGMANILESEDNMP